MKKIYIVLLGFYFMSPSKVAYAGSSFIDSYAKSYPLKEEKIRFLLKKHFSIELGEGFEFSGYQFDPDDALGPYIINYGTKPYQASKDVCRKMTFSVFIKDPEGEKQLNHNLSSNQIALGKCQSQMQWISLSGDSVPEYYLLMVIDDLKVWLEDSDINKSFKDRFLNVQYPRYENLKNIIFDVTNKYFCFDFSFQLKNDEDLVKRPVKFYLDFAVSNQYLIPVSFTTDYDFFNANLPSRMHIENRRYRCDLNDLIE